MRRKTLEAELEKEATARPGRGRRSSRPSRRSGRRARHGAHEAERQLLVILLRAREWLDRALERVGPGEFRNSVYRAIFEALVADPGLEPPLDGAAPEVQAGLESLLGDPREVEHTEQAFLDCLLDLEDRAFQVEHDGLKKALRGATSEEERAVLERLREVRRLRRGRWNVVGGTVPRPSRQEPGG